MNPEKPILDPKAGLQPPAPPAEAAAAPALTEDAGARALAEALNSSFKIVKILMAALVVVFACSGIFTVNPGEVAVVLRFGRPVGVGEEQLLKPGLHFALPQPIDEIVRIPVGQSRSVLAMACWAPDLDDTNQTDTLMSRPLRPGVDGSALTSDGNLIHARSLLKYRLQPAGVLNFEFNFIDPTNILQNVLNNAMLYAAAHYTADAVIFRDKTSYTDMVRQRALQLIDGLQLGVAVESLDVETSAPLEVRTAFNEVLNAQQTSRTIISEAEAYARTTTNGAIGQASVLVNEGITRSNQIIRTMAAEAQSFQDQLPYYMANPSLFQQRLLIETMERVLTNAQDKFYLPARADGKTRELRLQLNREPQKAKAGTP